MLQQLQLAAALAFVHPLQLAPGECVPASLLQRRTGEPDPLRGLLRVRRLALAMLKAYADRTRGMQETRYRFESMPEDHLQPQILL